MCTATRTTNKSPPSEAQFMEQGKDNLNTVVTALGGALSPWQHGGQHWEYAHLQVRHAVVRVGVSTGGVVSVNGSPFTPDLVMNVTVEAVKSSVLAATPATVRCTSCGRVFATAELSGNDYVALDVGVCPCDDCVGRDANHEQYLAIATT